MKCELPHGHTGPLGVVWNKSPFDVLKSALHREARNGHDETRSKPSASGLRTKNAWPRSVETLLVVARRGFISMRWGNLKSSARKGAIRTENILDPLVPKSHESEEELVELCRR